MPAPNERAGFLWCAFLHTPSRRSVVMLTLNTIRHGDLKYGAWRTRYRASVIVRATSSALDGYANRIEGGAARCARIARAIQRSQWACGQSGPGSDFSSSVQRYAVRCPFNQRPDEDRHQPLGAALLVAGQPELHDGPVPNTT